MSFLHFTNGSAIVPLMREAGISGLIVPWDDVLHEGPVPAGLNVAALRDVRADFLARCGWGARDVLARSLAERDAVIEQVTGSARGGALRVDEIVLWFEHDLFDQLQLIQILDRLPVDGGLRVTAVPGHDYLGHQPASRYPALFGSRCEVTSAARLAARDAWNAFRSPDPRVLVDALIRISALPHLPRALLRHLQQFPDFGNGLSRTEDLALTAVARGATTLLEAFHTANAREDALFMGDAAFLVHVKSLTTGPRPLIRTEGERVALTDDGRQVLAGTADRVAICGIDRWLGGVRLRGHGPTWRWHQHRGTIAFA